MNFFYIFCTTVLLTQYSSPALSCSSPLCKCRCEKDPPLKLVFQITPHFKEVQSCGRKFTSTQRGVRLISYHGRLNQNESALELCDCIHGYLSQKDWLDGSTKSCCVKKNIATMTLKGQPDPKFDNSSKETSLEQLENTFQQFRKAVLDNHHCRVSTKEDTAGKIHFFMECDLRSDSPCKEKLCRNIERYLNQGNWLGEMTYKCEIRGKFLLMEMTGKDADETENTD